MGGVVTEMRIVCIQHVPFEDAGVIAPWAAAHEHRFEVVRLYEGQELPSVSDVDWAVVMGGPMSVNDEAHFPWLRTEKDWMRRVIEQGSGVLGICLGAQMIAQVLGARVFPNACKEIGWFPVFKTQDAPPIRPLAMLPTVMTPFHWHGETFDIPAGAAHAFGNQACPNQGFVYDERVMALQFHLEITHDGVRRLIENCPGDLDTGPSVQDSAAMTSNARAFDNAHMAMHTLLDEMARTTQEKEGGRR